jgi:ATP-dependent DNA helicase PIF1
MEWILLIGAIWFGTWVWGEISESREQKQRQIRQAQDNSKGIAAYNRLHAQVQPTKLNVEKADIGSIQLSTEQRKVYDVLEYSDNNVYITGKAGTGKSLLLEYFVSHTQKTVAVVAPTGIAALNVGGMTIHSFFKFPPDVIDPKKINVDYKTREILRNIDAIVIDEVSMIRVDLMEGISAKLQIARRDDRPFGGCQMIMFGDLYQLPPVVADGQLHRYFNHNYGGVYFFNAPSVEKTDLQIYELGNIFRQKDPQFRNILNSIRNGDGSPEVLSKLNVRTGVEMPETGFVTLAGTNSTVSRINHKKLAALEGNEKTYEAEVTGDIKESAFPTERRLRLKVGAQIMMLKNDTMKPRRWVNGTLGVVVRLGIDSIRVNIDGVEHTVNRETWQKIRYEYNHEERKLMKIPVSEFTQLPVRLAWAMTIHKSQGQTYESVAVDMSDGAFAHGQTYVALSRCKSMEGLYLTTAIRREDIMVDDEIVEFMKKARIAG